MNYLAHAVLSFNLPEILAGNMTSDFIKGRKKFDFTAGIQKGIALHRAIDEFTDSHPVTAEAKQYFRPAYRLYSGAFIDITYDHFLANDKNVFSHPDVLELFSQETYQHLLLQQGQLPAGFRSMLPFMIKYNWLYNYQSREGIQRSFAGLVHRAAYIQESETAFVIFQRNYEALQNCYKSFFPLLKQFAWQFLQLLEKK
jgi:acyl carrier protein phosphodiesterase